MTPVGRFIVAGDHPSLPGHFPGHPVVPGVLLLEEAIACILAVSPGQALAGVTSAKFLRAVAPDQAIEVAWESSGGDHVSFICAADGQAVLRGTALLTASQAKPPPR
jgi:3-hydroxymyristoyl/3-hydroxydecanoyl-(acyl carrier protein) dehydratase